MRLSRTTTYAIQAVMYLGRTPPGEAIPCSQLARDCQMPERFLLQILRALVKSGILGSSRGVDGGYFLAHPPEQITLRDLVDVFEPFEAELPTLEGQTREIRAQLLNTLELVSRAANKELQKVNVAKLIAEKDADQ